MVGLMIAFKYDKGDSLKTLTCDRRSLFGCLLIALVYFLGSGCTHAIPRFGMGGRYLQGRSEITKTRGGNVDQAIVALESVAREDPTYKDSLTLLGRAYYAKGRYGDAKLILQRALAVEKEDEIAWLVLGMTQLRQGEDGKGLEAFMGGITLLGKKSAEGYRGYIYWDLNGKVRIAIRRGVAAARKGLEEKEDLIRSGQNILVAIDEEDWKQESEKGSHREGVVGY